MKNLKCIISGGGTGGHIYPAVAIANEIKIRFPEAEILFVGAQDKMEMQKIPQAGYRIEGLWIAGIQRKLTFDNLLFPAKLLRSMWKSRNIIKSFRPDIAIGTGGFASGPLIRMAAMMKIPTLIQEQNSFPGITNKWLSRYVQTVCVAYPDLERFFPKDKIILTGNPVRSDLLDVSQKRLEAQTFFNLNHDMKTLLVLGGSLGSARINQLIFEKLIFFQEMNVQVIWQCGKGYYALYQSNNEIDNIQVHAFLDRMDLAYAAADLIISRAGASSISELALVGKPVIFIPSPHVAEDHQTKNAQAIVNENGAIILKESQLNDSFDTVFSDLLQDEQQQQILGSLLKKWAKPKATQEIVDCIEKLILN